MIDIALFRIFPRYFSLVRHKIFRRNLRYFRPLKSHYWSNGRNISEISPIFFYVFRRGKIFRRYLRYTGASSNIRLLQDVKKYRRSLQNVGISGKTPTFSPLSPEKKISDFKKPKSAWLFQKTSFMGKKLSQFF